MGVSESRVIQSGHRLFGDGVHFRVTMKRARFLYLIAIRVVRESFSNSTRADGYPHTASRRLHSV